MQEQTEISGTVTVTCANVADSNQYLALGWTLLSISDETQDIAENTSPIEPVVYTLEWQKDGNPVYPTTLNPGDTVWYESKPTPFASIQDKFYPEFDKFKEKYRKRFHKMLKSKLLKKYHINKVSWTQCLPDTPHCIGPVQFDFQKESKASYEELTFFLDVYFLKFLYGKNVKVEITQEEVFVTNA